MAGAPIGSGETLGGILPVREVRPAHAIRVTQPAFFDLPEIKALFRRAFDEGGNEARFDTSSADTLAYLKEHIRDPGEKGTGVDNWLVCFVVLHKDAGFCGFVIACYTPWPMCQNCCLAHFHLERGDCREALLNKAFGWAYGHGLTKISLTNATGRSDEAHMRLFRRFGRGKVNGSVIVYDLEDRYGRAEQ